MTVIRDAEGEVLYGVGEVAEVLGVSTSTIRQWERTGALPEDLRPVRDRIGHRRWYWWQVESIEEWQVRGRQRRDSALAV
jgi:predicted site-specific integrase-resolvase